MSITLPASMKYSASVLTSAPNTISDVTQDGGHQVRRFGGHRWMFSLTIPFLSTAEWKEIYAAIANAEGQYESFQIIHPIFTAPRGTGAGSPLTNGASQTGKTLVTDGWSTLQTVMKAGDVFTIAGHNKVYMVTADANSDGGGNCTLNIFPPLQYTDYGNNAAITVTNVPFRMRFVNREVATIQMQNSLYSSSFSIDLIESKT